MRELHLSNKNFRMRLWKKSDFISFYEGISSIGVDDNLRSTYPRTFIEFIKFVERSYMKTVLQDFAIVQKENAIGGLSFIDDSDLMVELACLWISDPYRGMGLAKDAILTLITYINEIYPNRGIFGQIYEFNKSEIFMMDQLGWKLTGDRDVPYRGRTVSLLRYEYNK